MEKFRVFLEGVRVGLDERSKSMIRVAFEWPQAAYDNAHEVTALKRIIELLPHRCLFEAVDMVSTTARTSARSHGKYRPTGWN
eukprot:14418650-Heterocapsa_arctica.AAC.1